MVEKKQWEPTIWKPNLAEDQHNHRCLVREMIRRRMVDRTEAHDAIERFMKKHPDSMLRHDCGIQWGRGNRGEYGCWINDTDATVASDSEHVLQEHTWENPDQRERPSVPGRGGVDHAESKVSQGDLFGT